MSNIDLYLIMVTSGLVFLTQRGFLCLESGLTHSKNAINVAIKNLTDCGLSLLLFWMIGFGLMFGPTHLGLIGSDLFMPEVGRGDVWPCTFFVFQAMFCATAMTSALTRMKFAKWLMKNEISNR